MPEQPQEASSSDTDLADAESNKLCRRELCITIYNILSNFDNVCVVGILLTFSIKFPSSQMVAHTHSAALVLISLWSCACQTTKCPKSEAL
jgi:hypothetical protein